MIANRSCASSAVPLPLRPTDRKRVRSGWNLPLTRDRASSPVLQSVKVGRIRRISPLEGVATTDPEGSGLDSRRMTPARSKLDAWIEMR